MIGRDLRAEDRLGLLPGGLSSGVSNLSAVNPTGGQVTSVHSPHQPAAARVRMFEKPTATEPSNAREKDDDQVGQLRSGAHKGAQPHPALQAADFQ